MMDCHALIGPGQWGAKSPQVPRVQAAEYSAVQSLEYERSGARPEQYVQYFEKGLEIYLEFSRNV